MLYGGPRDLSMTLLSVFTLRENIQQASNKYPYGELYSITGYYKKLTTACQSHYQTGLCFLMTRRLLEKTVLGTLNY